MDMPESTLAAAPQHDLTALVVPLLKSVLYRADDAPLWSALLKLRPRVADYVAVMGLDLVLDEAEGYAFLRSRTQTAAPGTAPAPELSGQPAAGLAAQKAGRVRCQRW
jgi:Domain of unknown function (DUF4194)